MSTPSESLFNIRILDELAERKSFIHNIHPVIKILTTVVYLLITISFNNYDLARILPLVFYPITIMTLADIPIIPIFKRVILALPLIIGIGLFNPIYDRNPVLILPGITISGGWISFSTILIKGFLTILVALVLIATTGMTNIASALRLIKVPSIFVIQLLLTYRYIAVLGEESVRVTRAYSLRSAGERGIKIKHSGPVVGHLLIRSIERAQRIYRSMCARGFTGEYYSGRRKININDILYLAGWSLFFVIIRYLNISEIIGKIILGVGK